METPGVRQGAGAQGDLAAPAARPARRAAEAAAAGHGHAVHRGLHLQPVLGLPAGLRRHQPRAAAQPGRSTRSSSARRSAWCSCRSPVRCRTRSAASRSTGSARGSGCCSRSRRRSSCRPRTGGRSRWSSSSASGSIYGTVYGPLAAFWSEQFDTRYRYTALSTLYQVSGILASGLTPLIAAWLVTRGDGTLWWVAGYNVLVAAISLVCARFLPETRRSRASTARPSRLRPRELRTHRGSESSPMLPRAEVAASWRALMARARGPARRVRHPPGAEVRVAYGAFGTPPGACGSGVGGATQPDRQAEDQQHDGEGQQRADDRWRPRRRCRRGRPCPPFSPVRKPAGSSSSSLLDDLRRASR